MTKVNTLFRKGYLLAVVVIVANMFIGNEVKAMDKNKTDETLLEEMNKDMPAPPTDTNPNVNIQNIKILQEKDKTTEQKIRIKDFFYIGPCKYIGFLLQWENTINLVGGAVFSGANNYFKWWDYNPGWYRQFVWFGWRSKKFLNGMLQFEINFINLGRGAFWLLLGAYNFIKGYRNSEKAYIEHIHVSNLVAGRFNGDSWASLISLIVVFLLQGFVSMPLTLHFSKFSISISLDSIIWMGIGKILELKAKEEQRIKTVDNY